MVAADAQLLTGEVMRTREEILAAFDRLSEDWGIPRLSEATRQAPLHNLEASLRRIERSAEKELT